PRRLVVVHTREKHHRINLTRAASRTGSGGIAHRRYQHLTAAYTGTKEHVPPVGVQTVRIANHIAVALQADDASLSVAGQPDPRALIETGQVEADHVDGHLAVRTAVAREAPAAHRQVGRQIEGG